MEGFPLIHDKQVSSSSSGAQEQRVGRQKESRPWNTKAWLGLRTNTHEHTQRERESNKEKMKQHRMTTKHRKGLTISSKFLKLIVSKMYMLLQKFKEFQLYTKCYCSFICSLFLNLQFFRVFSCSVTEFLFVSAWASELQSGLVSEVEMSRAAHGWSSQDLYLDLTL